MSLASLSPGGDGRAAVTTAAPAFASSVAVASPSPLAPPVTIAEQPSIRICAFFLRHDDEHRARLDLLPGLHPDLTHRAGRGRRDRVLHLHRLQDDKRLARVDHSAC